MNLQIKYNFLEVVDTNYNDYLFNKTPSGKLDVMA